MKKFKKILAIVLSMVMVLGMGVTAFAEDGEADGGTPGKNVIGDSDDTGEIKVSGIAYEENNNVTVTAYQIIKANYDNGGSFSGYANVYADSGIVIGTSGEAIQIAEANLTAILDNHINKSDVAEDTTYSMTLSEQGEATATVPVGSYLIVIKGAETKVYSAAVASLYYGYDTDENGNVIEGGELNLVSADGWVKVNDAPSVDKNIVKDSDTVKGDSANIGDTIQYQVEIDPVPYYGGTYPVLNVVDTLSKGLTYTGTTEDNNVTVKVGDKELVKGTDYTVTVSATTDGKAVISVDFVVDGYKEAQAAEGKTVPNNYTLNEYAGKKVVISYSAVLNGTEIKVNENANENDVVLSYSKDSNVDGDKGDSEKKTYTYTFDLDGGVDGTGSTDITKEILTKTGVETVIVDGKEVSKPLAGAEFTLYTVNPKTFEPANDEDSLDKHIYTNKDFDGTVASTEAGQLPIRGLAEGTYYLQETKAPTGYTLNTQVFTIVIEAVYNEVDGRIQEWWIVVDPELDADGKLTEDDKTKGSHFNVTHTETTDDTEASTEVGKDHAQEVEIKNTKMSSLPSTGGIGTTIFTIGGCAIMIIAAGLFFISRRKSAK